MDWPRMLRILPAISSLFLLSGSSVFGQTRNPLDDSPDSYRQNPAYVQNPAYAQNPGYGQNPADGPYGPWVPAAESGRDSTPEPSLGHTEMEREMDQLNHNDPLGALSAPGAEANPGAPAGSDTVSVQQLRHPLSHRWEMLLAQLQSDLAKGHVKHANKLMARALKDPAAAPYAHGILGTHYLKHGWPAAAIPELQQAAQTLPMASVHSNLGYALCLMGQTKRGEEELQEALSLDGNSSQTRFLMGIVLLNQKSRDREARYDLRMAVGKVPTARLALAISHMRRGEMQAAENQLCQFLGPNRQDDLLRLWTWASKAASQPQPATAFGFPHQTSGAAQTPIAVSRH